MLDVRLKIIVAGTLADYAASMYSHRRKHQHALLHRQRTQHRQRHTLIHLRADSTVVSKTSTGISSANAMLDVSPTTIVVATIRHFVAQHHILSHHTHKRLTHRHHTQLHHTLQRCHCRWALARNMDANLAKTQRSNASVMLTAQDETIAATTTRPSAVGRQRHVRPQLWRHLAAPLLRATIAGKVSFGCMSTVSSSIRTGTGVLAQIRFWRSFRCGSFRSTRNTAQSLVQGERSCPHQL